MTSTISTPTETSQEAAAADPKVLFDIGVATWSSSILRVFCSLGVPERLADGPKTSEQLAEECGANASLMFRFLRSATMTGVCAQTEGTTFELTALGQYCRDDHPRSLNGFLLLVASPEYLKCWSHLEHVVKTGETAIMPALGIESYFDLFKIQPSHTKIFAKGMKGFMTAPSAIAKSSAFAGLTKFYDIGAGPGELTTELLRMHPSMQGVTCDLPVVVATVEIPEDLKDRCTSQVWNFLTGDFNAISGGDGYILKHIIHNWDDESCVKILSKIAQAMLPGGKVFVIESGPVPPDNTPHFSKIMDMNMAVLTGAKERTTEEHSSLFGQAGLKLEDVEILDEALCVLTAVKQ
ncbi:hypothetical protein BSKO_06879 [Bryopsis sp. KO-2023]|nr:hypothetical protein BSKO_06879 [Bryopsis sp. KO-2023]